MQGWRAKARFAAWLKSRVRGERIPERLWDSAAKVAGDIGVCQTSKSLQLDYYALQRRLKEQTHESAAPAFIELTPPVSRTSECVIELEDARGASMRMHLKGVDIAEKQHRSQFDEQELAQLATSIESLGVIQPIVVRWDEPNGRFVVVAGERRLRAAKLANLTEIPCRVMRLSDSEIAEIQLVENLSRKDLNAIELAKAFQDVMNRTSQTAKAISKRLGMDATTVTRTLRLLRLPDDVQQLVIDGTLSSRQAREIARVTDEPSQRAFVRRALDDGLSGNEVEDMVKSYLGEKRKTVTKPRKNAAPKPTTQELTFATSYGTVQFVAGEKVSNHHVAVALKEALEEVEHRINNGVTD